MKLTKTGETMVEYHVDTCNLFQKRMDRKARFNGTKIVRYKQGRMLILWKHNGTIFKQYIFP